MENTHGTKIIFELRQIYVKLYINDKKYLQNHFLRIKI